MTISATNPNETRVVEPKLEIFLGWVNRDSSARTKATAFAAAMSGALLARYSNLETAATTVEGR